MKKLGSLSLVGLLYLGNTIPALAQNSVGISITNPGQGIAPNSSVSQVLTNAFTLIFMAAILVVLFFLIIGAFQWITSGGEKEKIGKARGMIINALIGLAILALAFLIVRVVGNILNINFSNLTLPWLGQNAACPATTPNC